MDAVGCNVPPLRVIGPEPKLVAAANWRMPLVITVLHVPLAVPDNASVPEPLRISGPVPEMSDDGNDIKTALPFCPEGSNVPPAAVRINERLKV